MVNRFFYFGIFGCFFVGTCHGKRDYNLVVGKNSCDILLPC